MTADFDCSRSGSFRTVFGARLRFLFAMECGLQLPWRKHYSVLDFLTSSAFKGRNDRLSRVDACKDKGHADTSSVKRVTSSSEDDCSVFSMKRGSLVAATKSRI